MFTEDDEIDSRALDTFMDAARAHEGRATPYVAHALRILAASCGGCATWEPGVGAQLYAGTRKWFRKHHNNEDREYYPTNPPVTKLGLILAVMNLRVGARMRREMTSATIDGCQIFVHPRMNVLRKVES